MKNLIKLLIISILFINLSCSKENLDGGPSDASLSGSNGSGGQAGVITAGEWNDLDNWDFWTDLLAHDEYSSMPDYWGFYTSGRISVRVNRDGDPVINAKVVLRKEGNKVWAARTDNEGKVELWINLFQDGSITNLKNYSLEIDGVAINQQLTLFRDGVNEVSIGSGQKNYSKVEISFIVDATGSMSDELSFLKEDLKDVINRVQNENSYINISTSSVFYRDEGDDYVVKKSDFTEDIDQTINFINKQSADGGGDLPEAVHVALKTCVNELQWSDNTKTKIAFLLLDAPPHYQSDIIESIHQTIIKAAEKGIRIIPITASGINKETEFLMRFLSISTNGTYVFITNDSGVGNDHLIPSVGNYKVEYLNNLMVRLIKKYSN